MAATIVTEQTKCETCVNGCMCEAGVDPMCEHFGCWGIPPTKNAPSTCPGAPAERRRLRQSMIALGLTPLSAE